MNNDLISRSALLRTCEGEEAEMGATWDYEGLKAAIELAPPPAVDAVHVVRCHDCVIHGECGTEKAFILAGTHDGFCWAGRRKGCHAESLDENAKE